MHVVGLRTQQGAVVDKDENQEANSLPLWFVKGDSRMTPGQREVITGYVIHKDGGSKIQPYCASCLLTEITRGGAGRRLYSQVARVGGQSIWQV